MNVVNRVRNKLEEYDLEVYTEYTTEDSEYIFYVECMLLFINIKNEYIGVSFQATTKPERAAKTILILSELDLKINVMESFIYDTKNRVLTGLKAFELVDKTKQTEIIENFLKNQTYQTILRSTEYFHKC